MTQFEKLKTIAASANVTEAEEELVTKLVSSIIYDSIDLGKDTPLEIILLAFSVFASTALTISRQEGLTHEEDVELLTELVRSCTLELAEQILSGSPRQ
jgi:hypothetical protein